jgi:hypothetical protein
MQAANSATSWCTAAGSSFGLPAGLGCWLSGDRRDRRHGADGDNLGHDRKRIHLRAACEVPQTWSADRYGVQMASPSASSLPADPAPPPADPIAIRACLSPRLVAKFDADWDVVLDQAKVSKDLAGCTVCCTSGVTSPTLSCAIQVATSGYKPKPSRSYAPARIRGLAPSRTCRPSFGSG